jgi:predicted metal-binding transcription factor (methanogenesis marker protein 9)
MDSILIVITGTIAGFGAVAFGLKTQAKAIDKLAEAVEKLRDSALTRNAPSRDEHLRLEERVSQIAIRQTQIGTELENIRFHRREVDGG